MKGPRMPDAGCPIPQDEAAGRDRPPSGPGEAWRDAGVAGAFIGERRAVIPLWQEQADLLLTLLARIGRPVRRVLDLGSGDGVVAELVLDRFPSSEAVLVDFSEPMLPPFDAVLSAFCIHHLPDPRKRALYGEVLGLLAPGGALLNWEHVAVGSLAEGLFDDAMIAGLLAAQQGTAQPRSPERVARAYHERPDAAENRVAAAEEQAGWLREIGFEQVDVYFKWLELSVFGGVRPAAPRPRPEGGNPWSP